VEDQIGVITCPANTLAAGASMTCTATGTAAAGQYANVGTVTGTAIETALRARSVFFIIGRTFPFLSTCAPQRAASVRYPQPQMNGARPPKVDDEPWEGCGEFPTLCSFRTEALQALSVVARSPGR
jgi:hypothetical protein